MAMNPLPPQAYTKETLAKAYAWLQGQNDSIKEIATHPDVLVSLYLKAKLNGDEALERPSIQNFRNELKNLTGLLGELEGKSSKASATFSTSSANSQGSSSSQGTSNSPGSSSSPGSSNSPVPGTTAPPASTASPAAVSAAAAASMPPLPPMPPKEKSASPSPSRGQGFELDVKTWQMIKDMRSEMNLSHESEALRLLVSVGYKRLKSL